jgi:hypothetical protein
MTEPIIVASDAKRQRLRRALLVVVATVLAGVGVGAQVALVTHLTPDANSPIYPVPHQKPEVLLNAHDGKFFAAVAADPLLSDPDRIGPEVGQRASRPLFSWLAWLAALGSHDRIPWALMALTALSIGALVGAMVALADALGHDGGSPWLLCVLGTPGVVALVAFPGLNDALGAALAVVGFAAWKRSNLSIALAAFAAGGLCHEALLICPLAIFAADWLAQRRWPGVRWLLAFVPYMLWVGVVRFRVGEWPTASSHGNLGAPFAGFIAVVDNRWQPFDAACFAVIVLAGLVAWTRLRDQAFRLALLGFAAVAIVVGPYPWARWVDFGRILLPVCVLGVVGALAPARQT